MIRLLSILLLCSITGMCQSVKLLNSGTIASLRGLSPVSDKIIWASGNKGSVGLSVDGGNNWQWFTVKGYETSDFRDIEGFSATAAVIMGTSAPAYILKTKDGGNNWEVVYQNKDTGMFLDAMDFLNDRKGVVIGDPVNHHIFLAQTTDGGNTWLAVPTNERPIMDSGEACFASSGTNIRFLKNNNYYYITGGVRSRLFIKTKTFSLPILQGQETTGANSIAIKNANKMIVVGGDFNVPVSTTKICYITDDGGKTWRSPGQGPYGYRSCIEYLDKNRWITCGLNGVDFTLDDGKTWKPISAEGFNVCRKAKKGRSVFFAGANGKIGKLKSRPL